MKKMYIAPVVEVNEIMVSQIMALSVQADTADDSEVLGKKEMEWDMWADDED